MIREIGETYEPEGATAIVMDPQTSQVLGMANWPSVDPYALDEAETEDLQNMATSFTFEPGSTFKAFTVAGALEEGLVKPSTPFNLAPTITVADRTIEEAHARGPVTLTVADILAQSSNVGAVTIGLELNSERGDDAFDTWIRRFGFGETDRNRLSRRGEGDRAAAGRVLRLQHGQPADRPGPGGHTDPDGHRLLGDRQRRRPAQAAAGPLGGRRAGRRGLGRRA